MKNKIEIYTSVGRMPDISNFQCQDIFVNGEYIGTYQPEMWHSVKGEHIKLLDFSPLKEEIKQHYKEYLENEVLKDV